MVADRGILLMLRETVMDEPTIPGELAAINDRLNRGEIRMAAIERDLSANTSATREVVDNTRDLLDAFDALQGAFKVLGWIGRAARPFGWIAAAVAACAGAWAALRD